MSINKYIESGKKLPAAANSLAIGTYTQFLDKYPILEKIKPEHWDFILTIAGIFVGMSLLNDEGIPENEKDTILDAITNAGIEIYPECINACEDCRKYVDRTYTGLSNEKEYKNDTKYLYSDSLGSWVVRNLFGHVSLNENERDLVRILGAFLVHSFISWWK